MAKRAAYYAEAERLYVQEQCTIAEIASRLRLGEKTVREWKKDGVWDDKRKSYLAHRQAFHEELYEFSRHLMHSIQTDMAAGTQVDPGRMYAFTKMLPLILKVKDYEDIVSEKEKDGKSKDLSDETLKLIQKKILGIG